MDRPSYYGVCPAEVRYDFRLPASARLLYVELSALSNYKGYCWASNQYFMKYFDVCERTVKRWLEALEAYGYITITNERNEFNKKERKIYLTVASAAPQNQKVDKNVQKSGQKCPKKVDKNVRSNNTSINNNINTARARVIAQPKNKCKPKFTDFEQREYDWTKIEAALFGDSS